MLPRPITSPEHTALKLDRQWTELLACLPTPTVVYTARVMDTPASTDRLKEIPFDGGVGTLANVLPGMTIFVGQTAGGWERGQARIRKAPIAGTFYIGTESEIEVTDDDYLTVVDEFGLWQKRVRIEGGVIYLDEDVVYAGQNAAPLPVVVMGGPVVLELPALYEPGMATAIFDASGSWAPGGGTPTFSWSAPGSASSSGMATATPAIVYAAAGRYRVACTVTINGVSNTRYEYVQVFDTTHPPVTQFQVRGVGGSKSEGGYTYQVTMFAEAGLATVRDRAQVILFTRDHAGADGARVYPSYATGRENILCTGWIAGETIVWSPDLSSVTFTVEGAHAWLGRITAYPQGLQDVTSTPALWTDYKVLTMTAFVWHVLTWRSTVAQAIDCIVEQSTTRAIELAAAATTLWEQLVVTAGQRLLAPPVTDHLSRLFVLVDSQMRDPTARTMVAEVMTLDTDDWRMPITLNRTQVQPVGMVDLNGFAYDGTTPTALFSLAPGRVWKRFGRVQSVQALLLTNQVQANQLAGLIAGQANNEYPSITVQLAANNRYFDIAPDCCLLLTLPADATPRGVSFTGKRLIVRRVSYAYDSAAGNLLTTLELEAETFAELAVTGDAPPVEPEPPPEPPPPDLCPTGYHWDAGLGTCVPDAGGTGDGNTLLAVTATHVGLTQNFLSGFPNYVDKTGSLVGPFVDCCLDPFDPANVAYVLKATSLYQTTNLQSNPPTWTALLTGRSHLKKIRMSIVTTTLAGFIAVLEADTAGAVANSNTYLHCYVTPGGWQVPEQLAWGTRFDGDFINQGLDVSQHAAASVYAVGSNAGALIFPENRRCVFKSSDGGFSVTSWWDTPEGQYCAGDLHIPYADNGDDGVQWGISYYDKGPEANLEAGLWRKSGGFGGAWVDRSPGGYTMSKAYCLITPVASRAIIYVFRRRASQFDPQCDLWYSDDEGLTWSLVQPNVTEPAALGLWPYNTQQVYFCDDDRILFSTDGGVTLQDKTGDWAAVMGAPFANPVQLIPVWVAY